MKTIFIEFYEDCIFTIRGEEFKVKKREIIKVDKQQMFEIIQMMRNMQKICIYEADLVCDLS